MGCNKSYILISQEYWVSTKYEFKSVPAHGIPSCIWWGVSGRPWQKKGQEVSPEPVLPVTRPNVNVSNMCIACEFQKQYGECASH